MCLVYSQPKPHELLVSLVQHWCLHQARGAVVKLYRKKSCVTYRTSTGPHRARGTCWASLSLQGTRVVTGCLCSSPGTATPGALYSSNPIHEDALPYLQVGRQDQEDRWDLHCPKQLENWKITYFVSKYGNVKSSVCCLCFGVNRLPKILKWSKCTVPKCICTPCFGVMLSNHSILQCERSPTEWFSPPSQPNPRSP